MTAGTVMAVWKQPDQRLLWQAAKASSAFLRCNMDNMQMAGKLFEHCRGAMQQCVHSCSFPGKEMCCAVPGRPATPEVRGQSPNGHQERRLVRNLLTLHQRSHFSCTWQESLQHQPSLWLVMPLEWQFHWQSYKRDVFCCMVKSCSLCNLFVADRILLGSN